MPVEFGDDVSVVKETELIEELEAENATEGMPSRAASVAAPLWGKVRPSLAEAEL